MVRLLPEDETVFDKNSAFDVTMLGPERLQYARNVYLAESFKHECRKRGVKVLFSKLPEVNTMVDLVVIQVLQAFDQLHSMMSREKGLAGMAENVRQGYRAGGRAPFGYELKTVCTGSIRDGAPVEKSKLVPGLNARAVTEYLRGRAQGNSGQPLARRLGIKLSPSSLIGIEWNALTYAGHTVWNVHASRDVHGTYEGGTKRRPRSEWVIQRNTHEALITEEEAERILSRLESRKNRRTRRNDFLLSGLLVTPEGRRWHGDGDFYRAGTKSIKADSLERAVMAKLSADLTSDEFVKSLIQQAHSSQQPRRLQAELAAVQGQIDALTRKCGRLINLLPETTAQRPLLLKLEEFEKERELLWARAAAIKTELDSARVVTLMQPAQVRQLLDNLATNLQNYPAEQVKDLLRGVLNKITLTRSSTGAVSACLDYEIPIESRDKVASPSRTELTRPTLTARRMLRMTRRERFAA